MAIYDYLLWGILLSVLSFLLVPLFRPHSRVALLSGIFAAPLGLLDIVFAPEYWAPSHIFSSKFSIEGVLFSFGNGVLIWPVAVLPFWKRLSYQLRPWDMILRCLICWSIAAIIILLVWKQAGNLMTADIMTSALLALIVCGIFILWQRPELWKLVISGIIGFSILYAIELMFISLISPEFASVWSPSIRAGHSIFGFPIEEFVWAFVYGGVWSSAVAYGCNVQFSDRKINGDIYRK